ncbi:hypothetical protein LVJ82_09150 [Vitreoscilla massiliensis]|uniref:Acid shock protein n=1 Tax=Vitreoscilla massiliensis TaxID=1689272 RepID=A0ABY4E761_9NEIS|nr:hypothetical protein [Vitreoscilla massiliensis]UOO91114.1 hypothetical protein LVJ82_09150 [Vitreoscilla massiliensis]
MKKIVTAIFATVLASFTAMSMAATVPSHQPMKHPVAAHQVKHVKKVAVKHPTAQHRPAHKVVVKKHPSAKHHAQIKHAQAKKVAYKHRLPAKHVVHHVKH